MYVCMYVGMYVCMCMFMCMCMCMYVCIYVCMYVCMCVCMSGFYFFRVPKKGTSAEDVKGAPARARCKAADIASESALVAVPIFRI